MGAWGNFIAWLTGDNAGNTYKVNQGSVDSTSDSSDDSTTRLDTKLLTMASAIGYLASTLSLCEWRLMEKGENRRDSVYYRLNNCPNCRQSKAEFCQELVTKLAIENEVLIFTEGRGYFIAESWTEEQRGTKPTIYRDIRVDNDTKSRTRSSEDVMHLRMSWIGLAPLLEEVADEYIELMNIAGQGYERQAAEKGILTIAAAGQGTAEQQQYRERLITQQFKKFLSSKSAVLPLRSGYTYTPHSTGARNTSEMNDIINLTDEWAERVALALRVPSSLLKGNVENTTHGREDLVIYGVKPLADMIEQEYNAKAIGIEKLAQGDRLVIDTEMILLATPEAISNYCDKMLSCGQISINEGRTVRKVPLLEEPEADEHYVTLNYGALGSGDGAGEDSTKEVDRNADL